MATVREVAKIWAEGKPANGSGALSSDGQVLMSYNTPIAVRMVATDRTVIYYLSDHRYSVTTSKHQSYARCYADNDAVVLSESEIKEIARRRYLTV